MNFKFTGLFRYVALYCFTIGLGLETRIFGSSFTLHLTFPLAVVVTVQSIFEGLLTLSKFYPSTVVADRSKTDGKAKRTTFLKHTLQLVKDIEHYATLRMKTDSKFLPVTKTSFTV